MLSSRNFLMLTGLGALLATVVLFVAVVTRQPAADAAPTTTTTSTTPTSTTSTTTTSATTTGAESSPYATDIRGFVDSTARCDDGQTAVAVGHTQRSLVVVCSSADGGYQYRGVRVSDGAALKATASPTSDGFEAETDGALYSVSPTELAVTSGGKVIYRDTWIEYRQQPILTTAASTTGTTATTTATTPTTTTPTATTSKPAG
ncbi:hypothetical protein BH09ACT8_BH09ACT8_24720 [soil metagenome]